MNQVYSLPTLFIPRLSVHVFGLLRAGDDRSVSRALSLNHRDPPPCGQEKPHTVATEVLPRSDGESGQRERERVYNIDLLSHGSFHMKRLFQST